MENQIQGGFLVASENQKTKRSDVQLLPAGSNLGILYCLVDLGTQMESFNGGPPEPKRKIQVIFEFPQMKQFFYEDDTEQRSTTAMFDSTLNVGDKSKLKQIIDAAHGRSLSYDEASKYDISNLIGQTFNVQIMHKRSTKDPNKIYANIQGVFSPRGLIVPVPFEPMLEKHLFFIDKDKNGNVIGNNFNTLNYAKLPLFLKKKILQSKEAIEYSARGGVFAQLPTENNQPGQQQQQPPQQQQFQQQQQPAPANPTIVLKDPSYTLEQWFAIGWDIQSLINAGHATYSAPPVQQQAPPPPPVNVDPNAAAFMPQGNQNLHANLGVQNQAPQQPLQQQQPQQPPAQPQFQNQPQQPSIQQPVNNVAQQPLDNNVPAFNPNEEEHDDLPF